MKIFIVVVDENRGYEVEKEDIEKALRADCDYYPTPECSYNVKELK